MDKTRKILSILSILFLILIDGIKSESSFTVTQQYIIIGCVSGFAGLVISVFILVCTFKCRSNNDSNSTTKSSSYNSSTDEEKGSNEKFLGNDGYTSSHSSIDRKLAKSAQMYHYQLHKQQLIDMEQAEMDKQTKGTIPNNNNAENEDGEGRESDSNADYNVYECGNIGKIQNMEVHNPLFNSGNTEENKLNQPG